MHISCEIYLDHKLDKGALESFIFNNRVSIAHFTSQF